MVGATVEEAVGWPEPRPVTATSTTSYLDLVTFMLLSACFPVLQRQHRGTAIGGKGRDVSRVTRAQAGVAGQQYLIEG